MKKTIVKVMVLTILAATLAGRGHSSFVSTEGTAAPEKIQTEEATSEVAETEREDVGAVSYKFAFLPNTQNNTLRAAANDTFKRLCDEKEYGYICLDSDYGLNAQLSQMADAAIRNFDAVSVIPIDSAGIRQGLEQIHEKSISILNVDTPVIDDDPDLIEIVIAMDAYNTGALIGQQMVANYSDGAKIAILDFLSNESYTSCMAGFLDGPGDARGRFSIVIQRDGAATLDISIPIIEGTIQANPDLNAFFCINNPSASGVAAATKASGKAGIGVYSIDTSPDGRATILDGPSTAVMARVPIGIAETVFEKAEELLTGGEIEKEILLPSFLINKEKAGTTPKDWW